MFDATTDHNKEMRRILDEHVELKERIARLINGYRSILQNCLEQMAEAHVDVADTVIALHWRDVDASLLAIPLANTASEAVEKHDGKLDALPDDRYCHVYVVHRDMSYHLEYPHICIAGSISIRANDECMCILPQQALSLLHGYSRSGQLSGGKN